MRYFSAHRSMAPPVWVCNPRPTGGHESVSTQQVGGDCRAYTTAGLLSVHRDLPRCSAGNCHGITKKKDDYPKLNEYGIWSGKDKHTPKPSILLRMRS